MTPTTTDRLRLDVLDHDECVQLLEQAKIGRVAVHSGALPAIFPVNFLLTSAGIVFRTNRGTKLAAATEGAVVAFEVDHADPMYHEGWSVLVVGRAQEITEASELEAASALPLRSWASTEADHYVRISMHLVSGRRIRTAGPRAAEHA